MEDSSGGSFIHRLHIKTKFCLMAACILLAVAVNSTASLYCLFILLLLLHGLCRHSFVRWKILMLLNLLGIWSGMIAQAIFYVQEPRTAIFCIMPNDFPILGSLTDGIYVYKEGLRYGALQALRTSILLLVGLLLAWTSDARTLLKNLCMLRVPYELAFMVMTAVRFIPVVADELQTVLLAQKLRGYHPVKHLRWNAMRQAISQTSLPILARSLRRAEILAHSVECRGFGRATSVRTDEARPRWEKIVCMILVNILIILLVCKLLGFLQYTGVFYDASLRRVYDILNVWL